MKGITRQLGSMLSSIDIYGQRVNLLIKRQEASSTLFAQVGSLAILGIVLFSFISLTQEMFSFANPNIVSKVKSNLNPEAFYFDRDNFYIAFGLADGQGLPIVNTPSAVYYTMKFQFCHQYVIMGANGIPQAKLDCRDIDGVNCPYSQINPELVEGISAQRLSFGTCMNTTQWDAVKNETFISGLSTQTEFRYISFSVKLCDNQTHNSKKVIIFQDCAPEPYLSTRTQKGFIQMAFTNHLLDQTQPGDPYNTVSKTDIYRYSQGQMTNIKYILSHNYFYDEQNFYYYFPQQKLYHTLSLVQSVDSTIADKNSICHLNFFLSDTEYLYYRTYNTFFDILGNVGGIQAFLVFIFGLFLNGINKQQQTLTLLNSIFSFDEDSQQVNVTGNLSERKMSRRETMSPLKLSAHKTETRNFAPLKKFLKQKDKKLTLNPLEYIMVNFSGKKKQLMQLGIEKIEKQLDITMIITKLLELEKLKHFLLNDHQVKLFDYIPKPVIKFNQPNSTSVMPLQRMKSQVDYFSKDNGFDKKVEEALEAYKKLKNSKSPEDKKLIDMLDSEVKDIFEEMIPAGVYGDVTDKDMSSGLYRGQTHGQNSETMGRGQTLVMKDIMDELDNLAESPYKFSKIQSPH